MTLDERLEAARRDYHRIGEGPLAGMTSDRARRTDRRAPWVLSVAAAVVLVVVVVALIERSDDGRPVTVDTETTSTVSVPETASADADFLPLDPDPDVRLDPAGPFADRERVRLSAPRGLSADWSNDWPVMCSTVVTESGSVSSCDHVDVLNAEGGYGGLSTEGSREVREIVVPRRVFTPVGYRDCGDPDVSCHVVVRRADGSPAPSERLEFEEEAPDPPAEPSLAVSAGSSPGQFVVTPSGLEPSAGWREAAEREGFAESGPPAFSVSLCSFGDGEPAVDVTGTPWGNRGGWWPRDGLGSNCDTLEGQGNVIDPERPDRPFVVDLSRELYGWTGWSDCRLKACYVSVAPATGYDSSFVYGLEGTVAARLPIEMSAPLDPRPALSIVETGPYRQGQVVTVTVSDIPDGYPVLVGVCRFDRDLSCGYGDQPEGFGPGTRPVELAADLTGCGPQQCFLALQSASEGLRPPATAPLPVEETRDDPPAS